MSEYKASIQYSKYNDGVLNFVEGIGFYGDSYKEKSIHDYNLIDDNFEFELYGNHVFDLFIDGDLVETFTCNEIEANKIIKQYFKTIPHESELS